MNVWWELGSVKRVLVDDADLTLAVPFGYPFETSHAVTFGPHVIPGFFLRATPTKQLNTIICKG